MRKTFILVFLTDRSKYFLIKCVCIITEKFYKIKQKDMLEEYNGFYCTIMKVYLHGAGKLILGY